MSAPPAAARDLLADRGSDLGAERAARLAHGVELRASHAGPAPLAPDPTWSASSIYSTRWRRRCAGLTEGLSSANV